MKNYTKLIILAFLMMTVFGFINNIRGVLLPSIRDYYTISYSQVGLMLFLASLGFTISTFFGGLAADKFGQKKILLVGLFIWATAIALIPLAKSFSFFVIAMFLTNIGVGAIEIGVNSLGAKIFIKNTAVMFNFLHLFYGVGSTIGPRYAGWMLTQNYAWQKIYLATSVIVIFIFILLLFSKFPEHKTDRVSLKIPAKEIAKNSKIWLFGVVLGLAIVLETAIGNWLVNFLTEMREMNENSSSFYLSFFFITFTIGRLTGGYLAEKIGYVKIILYNTVASMILFGTGLLIGNGGAIFFSFVGFFVSIMYPTLMVIIMKEFTENTGSVMGFIITFAVVINMISNWLIGKSNDLFGVYYGFSSVIIYAILIIIFLLALEKKLTYLNREESSQNSTTANL